MYENGIANIIPSNLSRNPPWPGNKLPVSLILAILFKYETNKSPSWLTKETNNTNVTKLIPTSRLILKKILNNIIENKENTKEPIVPEIVLFGLIFVNLFPPMVLPTI